MEIPDEKDWKSKYVIILFKAKGNKRWRFQTKRAFEFMNQSEIVETRTIEIDRFTGEVKTI